MAYERLVTFRNQLSELERLQEVSEEIAEALGLPAKGAFELNLALDELLTNVISYAYQDEDEHEIRLTARSDSEALTLTMEDDGAPFNPLDAPEPDLDRPLAEREVGGLGVFFVRKLMDAIEYRREEGRNVVTLRKTLKPDQAPSD